MSDAAVKAHDLAVEAWMAEAERSQPRRVAKAKRHAVLTPGQMRYRASKEQALSAVMAEYTQMLAIDGKGCRLYLPSDV
jgi:hypothetical protein